MKTMPKYVLAKYVPDPVRMEPINIGVIVWREGQVVFKFLPETEAKKYVNDNAVYIRWIEYWSRLCRQDVIKLGRGVRVQRSDPGFLEVLAKTQSDNYLLGDGGEFVSEIKKKNLQSAAVYLFDRLVHRGANVVAREKDKSLKHLAKQLFDSSGISDDEDFKQNDQIDCQFKDVTARVKFNYSIRNGTVRSLFHRVNLESLASSNSAAFMFESASRFHSIDKGSCGAIVYEPSLLQQDSSELVVTASVVSQYATLINLAEMSDAMESARTVAGKKA